MTSKFLDDNSKNRIDDVDRDAIDLRDRRYVPRLMPLRPSLSLEAEISDGLRQGGNLGWLPRNQGAEGSCAGHALAALVDIQRFLLDRDARPVSARMLYQMARLHDDLGREDGTTLRAVVKGLYHNGVCSEEFWPYSSGETGGALDIARAKDARAVPLGAYYRLSPNLGDYHSALNECGVVLASASVHSGWSREAVRRNEGRIVQSLDDAGGHAFVIVGYDDKGFMILNSWGAEWGGFDGLRGVAHWSYQDWADTIMDGWVLRLGVSAPGAFHLTLGEQGIHFMQNASQAVTTPGHDVLGHMAHLYDGKPVATGAYPFSMESFRETVRYLARRPGKSKLPVAPKWDAKAESDKRGYRGVILRFGGSVLGLKEMAAQIAREKPLAKERGLYPYTIAWCNDFVEHTEPVLNSIFEEAHKQIGQRGDQLDELIEERVHGIGRAFWRDVGRAAYRSAQYGRPVRDGSEAGEAPEATPDTSGSGTSGPVLDMIEALLGLRLDLHIIADGAGAMLLDKVLHGLGKKGIRKNFIRRVATLDLITPTLGKAEFERQFGDLADALRRKGPSAGGRARCTLHVPSPASDARLCVGHYSKSILDLVEKGFTAAEERRDFIGKSLVRTRLPAAWRRNSTFRSIDIVEIDPPPALVGALSQQDLQTRTPLFRTILDRIAPPV